MYKAHLFAKNFEINEKSVWITIWPDFRQDVDLHSPNNKYYTDGDEVILKERNSYSSNKWAYVPENATWLLVEEWDINKSYHLHITCQTKEIVTPLGDEFNKKLNELLKEVRREYSRKKTEEIRLYFYDSRKSNLKLVENYIRGYKYILGRPFCNCSTDKEFEIPFKDCFILGRIKTTVGTQSRNLYDFVEPVHTFFLDFKKDEYDFFDEEYNSNIEKLSRVLMELLCFTIQQVYNMNSIKAQRVVAYIQNKKSNVVPEKAIELFIEEIKSAFSDEDVANLRELYNVLNAYLID